MDTATDTSVDKGTVWERINTPLLVKVGLSLILLGIGWLAVEQSVISRADVTPPTSLAGLPLTEKVTGQAALTGIEGLHSKGFPMADGAIAYYEGGLATVWISSTWASLLATRQVHVMTERIAEGQSPFTPIDTIAVEGVAIYVLTGMGQRHYYFQLDKRVVWLAVSPPLAEQSLPDLLGKIR